MKCPKCGKEMYEEYLFTRFSDEAEYYHYVCGNCGYEDMHLYKNTSSSEEC